jgi:hypothetical protein
MFAARFAAPAMSVVRAADSGWVRRRAHHFDQRCR